MTDAAKRKERPFKRPKQQGNNKFGQQKCIPHACVGLVGPLSWHLSSLALLPSYVRLLKHAVGTKRQTVKPGLILVLKQGPT